jgi:hypothetical protein
MIGRTKYSPLSVSGQGFKDACSRRQIRLAHREDEREYASAGVSLRHVNPAGMRQRDLTCEAEADTGATGFGAKKRYENLIDGRRRHAATIIGDCDANLPIGKVTAVHCYARRGRLCHRIDRVVEQVQQRVFEQFRIGGNDQIDRVDPARVCNALFDQRRGHQPLDAPNHVGQPNRAQHRARKIGELPVAIHKSHEAKAASLDRIHGIDHFARAARAKPVGALRYE